MNLRAFSLCFRGGLLLLALFSIACSSDERASAPPASAGAAGQGGSAGQGGAGQGGAGQGAAGATAYKTPQEVTAAYCKALGERCCARYEMTIDPTYCVKERLDRVGNLPLDEALASACMAELAQILPGGAFCDGITTPISCQKLFHGEGAVALGGDCKSDFDCALPAQGVVTCFSGKCQGWAPKAEGQGPCYGNLVDDRVGIINAFGAPSEAGVCDNKAGLTCNFQSGNGQCEKFLAEGMACDFDGISCQDALYCTGKVCEPRKALGGGCSPDLQDCVRSARCDKATLLCSEPLSLGEPCIYSWDCKSAQCSFGKCDKPLPPESPSAFGCSFLPGQGASPGELSPLANPRGGLLALSGDPALRSRRRTAMCRRTTCDTCHKPTFAGCGMHVEAVLGDVPKSDRCTCRDKAQAKAPPQEPGKKRSFWPSF